MRLGVCCLVHPLEAGGVDGEVFTRLGRRCGSEEAMVVLVVAFGNVCELTDAHRSGSGAFMHRRAQRQPPLPVGLHLGFGHRGPARPGCPAGRVLVGQDDEIVVEAPDRDQGAHHPASGDPGAADPPAASIGTLTGITQTGHDLDDRLRGVDLTPLGLWRREHRRRAGIGRGRCRGCLAVEDHDGGGQRRTPSRSSRSCWSYTPGPGRVGAGRPWTSRCALINSSRRGRM